MAITPKIKGTSILLTLDLVRELHGKEGVDAVLARLPEHIRKLLPTDAHVLPSVQYDFEAWAEVLLAAEELYGTPWSIARSSSRVGYRKLLKTTYANWPRPGEPLESIRRMPRLWEQVTKGLGEYEIVECASPREIKVLVTLHIASIYRTITEERVAGTLEAMIEASGAHGTVQLTRTANRAEYHITIDEA